MSDLEQAALRYGPLAGRISVLATATSSTNSDLMAAGEVLSALQTSPTDKYIWVSVIADSGLYYAFSNDSAATVDETATTGATRCLFLAANTEKDMLVTGRYFVHKATAAGKVRLAIAQP